MTAPAADPAARVGRHRRPSPEDDPPWGVETMLPPTPVRASDADLARAHGLARMRAKLMDPDTAAADLADRLRHAHVHAGRPSLTTLAEAVGSTDAALSDVLSGATVPSWVLVRELGGHLGVPPEVVVQEWFALWTAANMRRGR